MNTPSKETKSNGFQIFSMRDKSCTREDMIDHLIEQKGKVFSLAPTESDNVSKVMCTNGERIWWEDHFGKYLYDI